MMWIAPPVYVADGQAVAVFCSPAPLGDERDKAHASRRCGRRLE